jgi:tRNA A-37 threonylcarbamoyl transferase component Bud32
VSARPPGFEVDIYQAGRLRWLIRRSLVSERDDDLLKDPDRFLASPARLLRHSELITLGVISPRTPGAAPWLLRRLNYGRLRHRLRDVFRPTRAERAFRHGLGMEQAGIHTPRVLGAAVERRWRWPLRAYLLTEFMAEAATFEEVLSQKRGVSRELTLRLADLMARLHAHGFVHRDLNARNILVDPGGQPWLIDLDGVRHHPRTHDTQAQANVFRLAHEFLRHYPQTGPTGVRFLRRYCRQRKAEGAFERYAREYSRWLKNRG